jgi:hypothetical protein
VNALEPFRDERVLQAPNRSQPGPTPLCPGWPLSVRACPAEAGKERAMITAHKKLYENHTGDLTALKKLYDHYAKDCVRVAELTVDPRRREQYLKLASEWTEAAAALRVCIDEIDAAEDARKFNSHPCPTKDTISR